MKLSLLLGLVGVVIAGTCLASCDGSSGGSAGVFEAKVVPLLESRCADGACHGVVEGGTHELDIQQWLTFHIDDNGKITDLEEARASVAAQVNSTENPEFSTFLRKTLPLAEGGLFHFQGAAFTSRDNVEYQILSEYVASVDDGTEGADEPPLSALEQQFADDVYPVLVERGCMTATCHGVLNFGVSFFEPPAIPGTLEVPRSGLRHAYTEAKRSVTLWGDPLESRLITKMIPVEQGGIAHKGGNDLFLAAEIENGEDPRESLVVTDIVNWIMAERDAALGSASDDAGEATAVVFVGGPLVAAGPFDVQPFTPGTDLYRLDAPYTGTPVNVTEAIHDAPVDIRDPAISHDGTTIVFAMRTSADDAHNIYTIRLDGTGLAQLTTQDSAGPDGSVIGNFGPVFGPPGGFVPPDGSAPPAERIYFSSTRGGDLSDHSAYQNADLFGMDPDGANVEQLSFTVIPEVKPWFLASGEFSGTMAYTIKRSSEGGFKGVLFRFPIDHNSDHHIQPEAHPHFGMSEPQQVFYGIRELADGRAVVSLLDEGNVWRGGQLAMLERQFAVEIPEGQEDDATLPGFRHALTILSPDASRAGLSDDGLWLDPTPLPDGTVIVAHAAGPIDLNDPAAAPTPRLMHITLVDDRDTHRPTIESITELGPDMGMPQSQPVAVYPRPVEDDPHPRMWNDTDGTGTLVHSGVQVIEAVLRQLPPTAARPLRDDLMYVRAVAPLSVAGPLPVTPVPADETRAGHLGATNLAITGRMPLFAAVEVPVAEDGSLAAHIPAKVSVRVVTLNEDRIATGALQHQWYAVKPGERFPVGIPESSFAARCAGCHGAIDGDPNKVLQPPTDFVTQASVTAALYDEGDRRKPLDLPTVDGSFFVLVDFQAHVQPILDARCASCHTGAAAEAGLTLSAEATQHYTDAYESLLALGDRSAGGFDYVDALGYRARDSYLGEKLLGRELDAPGILTEQCPPPGAEQLTDDERLTLLRWIEFGATFVGVPPSTD